MCRINGIHPLMIVCSCNAIREQDLRKAARCGAPCPLTAYAHLGCEPECGSCLDHAAEIVEQERAQLLRTDLRAA
jgi:bacterioferritin-associated ferredoxin